MLSFSSTILIALGCFIGAHACTARFDNEYNKIMYQCGPDYSPGKIQVHFETHDGVAIASPQQLMATWKANTLQAEWSIPLVTTSKGCIELPPEAQGTLAVTTQNRTQGEGLLLEVKGDIEARLRKEILQPYAHPVFSIWRECGDWPAEQPNDFYLFLKLMDIRRTPIRGSDIVTFLGRQGTSSPDETLSLSSRGCLAVKTPLNGFLTVFSESRNLSATTDFEGLEPSLEPVPLFLHPSRHLSLLPHCGVFADNESDGRIVKVLDPNGHEVFGRSRAEAFFIPTSENNEQPQSLTLSTRGCVRLPSNLGKGKLIVRVNSDNRMWAATESIQEVVASDALLHLKDFFHATVFPTCGTEPEYTQGTFLLPLDISKSIDFNAFSVSIWLTNSSSDRKITIPIIVNDPESPLSIDLLEVPEDGAYNLKIYVEPHYHPSAEIASYVKSCPLIIDRTPPEVTVRNTNESEMGFLLVEPHGPMALVVSDRSPTKLFYCFTPAHQEVNPATPCPFLPAKDLFFAPDEGSWNLWYYGVDAANNTSAVPHSVSFSVLDIEKVNNIRGFSVKSRKEFEEGNPLFALSSALEAAQAWSRLSTEVERDLARNALLEALIPIDLSGNIPIRSFLAKSIVNEFTQRKNPIYPEQQGELQSSVSLRFDHLGEAISVSDSHGHHEAWMINGSPVDSRSLKFAPLSSSVFGVSQGLPLENNVFRAKSANGDVLWERDGILPYGHTPNGSLALFPSSERPGHVKAFRNGVEMSVDSDGADGSFLTAYLPGSGSSFFLAEKGLFHHFWYYRQIGLTWSPRSLLVAKGNPDLNLVIPPPHIQYSENGDQFALVEHLRVRTYRAGVLPQPMSVIGHKGRASFTQIQSVAYSPNSQLLATYSSNGQISLWSPAAPWSQETERDLNARDNSIWQDERTFLSKEHVATVRVLENTTTHEGALVKFSYEIDTTVQEQGSLAAFSIQLTAPMDSSGDVELIASDFFQHHVFRYGKILYLIRDDQVVKSWESADLSNLYEPSFQELRNIVSFAPEATFLLIPLQKSEMAVVDVNTGKWIAKSAFPSRLCQAGLSVQGSHMVALDYDGFYWIWDLSTGPRQLSGKKVIAGEYCNFQLVFSRDDRFVAIGASDILSLSSDSIIASVFNGSHDDIHAVATAGGFRFIGRIKGETTRIREVTTVIDLDPNSIVRRICAVAKQRIVAEELLEQPGICERFSDVLDK